MQTPYGKNDHPNNYVRNELSSSINRNIDDLKII